MSSDPTSLYVDVDTGRQIILSVYSSKLRIEFADVKDTDERKFLLQLVQACFKEYDVNTDLDADFIKNYSSGAAHIRIADGTSSDKIKAFVQHALENALKKRSAKNRDPIDETSPTDDDFVLPEAVTSNASRLTAATLESAMKQGLKHFQITPELATVIETLSAILSFARPITTEEDARTPNDPLYRVINNAMKPIIDPKALAFVTGELCDAVDDAYKNTGKWRR